MKYLILFFGLLSSLPVQAIDDPISILKQTADYVLEQVRLHKAELQKDSSKVYALVNEKITPHFDFRLMSRGALGRYWRQADERQKEILSQEFKEMLVRTYAMALLDYTNHDIEYLPLRGKLSDKKVMVMTRVRSNKGGPAVPINYRLYRNKNNEWKIYDVIVDGMSLVSNYRSAFADEIRKNGIEGLIKKLREHNQQFNG